MRIVTIVFGAALLSFASIAVGETPETAGNQLYDKMQGARDQARALYGSGKATPGQLRQAADILTSALALMSGDDVEELSYGNPYLAYRRYDVNRDLAVVYAELGDKDRALDAIEQVESVAWWPDYLDDLKNPVFDGLRDEPRFKAAVSNLQLVSRLMGDTALATPYARDLSESQRLAGLGLFWSTVKYGFAHFDNAPGLDWDQTYLDFIPKVQAAKTTHDYYDVLMRLAPLLHDGHTNIYPPKELQDAFYARPPIRTGLVEGHVLILRVDSPSLAKEGLRVGDEIIDINGQDVKRYAEVHVAPYVSASTIQDTLVRTYDYGLLRGDKGQSLHLRIRNGSGNTKDFTVARGGYSDVTKPTQFQFKTLPGDLAYIDLDSFESEDSVKAFESALPKIKSSKGLIIDMRSNGGGNGEYGLRILAHLTNAPIPTARVRYPVYAAYQQADFGPQLQWKMVPKSDETYDAKQQDIYTGPVVVLIGPRTFSAGEDFVLSYMSMHRGLTIGEPTGGSTGQPLMFRLPGGGIARVCVKRDSFPDGREFVGIGIKPDIELMQTVADIRADRDPVLDRAVTEITKH